MSHEKTQNFEATGVIAIVLSGGEGRRLGGQDKGLVNFQGKRLIELVIERIAPQVDDMVLSVNRNQHEYLKLGYTLVSDDDAFDKPQGPLSGIVSALQLLEDRAGRYLICTCDSPHLPKDYVARLGQQLSHSNSAAAVVFDGTAVQNLHCLISAQATDSLIDFFNAGGRAMHRWLAQNNVVRVDFSAHAAGFANYNTLESIK